MIDDQRAAGQTTLPHPGKPTTPPEHNWFFALRPSVADAQRIHASTEGLLSANALAGKRISAERLHVTLELVGHDLTPSVVDSACRAADKVAFPAFDVLFNAVMTLSAPSGPFVLSGAEGLDAVRRLRFELISAMHEFGFSPSLTYEPHMTLCYEPRHRVARLPIEPIGFHAAEFMLVKSHIGFSRHEVVRTWRLGGALAKS